jgi:transcriptional regulator GlxA family with amidase domain
LKRLLLAALIAICALPAAYAADSDLSSHIEPPANRAIKVAFVLSEGAVVIDFGGPWEVFSNVMLPGFKDMQESMPFELYTVGPSKKPIHTSGNRHAGMAITPDYDFLNAPEPDLVVVPAQRGGGAALSAWLNKLHAHHKIIMSVCTGAFKLAQAGLLDGKMATTHHGALDQFASQYPKIKAMPNVRYVQSDPEIFTSGGLSAGIDLALHMVEEYYGRDVAQATADNLEYQGSGWKTPATAN